MGILNAYLLKYASTIDISENNQYELYIRESERGTLLRNTQLLVVIILKSDLLFLEEIIGLIADYKKDKAMSARAPIRIIISSPKGSIYLHESITGTATWRKTMKKHRVCVINSENGTVCIKPGHIKNAVLTERLKALLEQYKYMNGMIFEREVFTVFNLCADAMKAM